MIWLWWTTCPQWDINLLHDYYYCSESNIFIIVKIASHTKGIISIKIMASAIDFLYHEAMTISLFRKMFHSNLGKYVAYMKLGKSRLINLYCLWWLNWQAYNWIFWWGLYLRHLVVFCDGHWWLNWSCTTLTCTHVNYGYNLVKRESKWSVVFELLLFNWKSFQ